MGQKNIIIIVMDTANFSSVADVRESTDTALSQVADRGTEYTRAFTASSWSLPSHASLFTGTYPSKHGAHAGYKNLENPTPYLPEILRERGYETVAVSNNTWISEEFGFGEGFDTFYKTWQYVQSDTDLGEIARTKEGREKLRSVVSRLREGNPLVNAINAVYGQYIRKQEDDGAKQTNKWLEQWLRQRNESRPFFLFINYLEPHLEYRPPERVAEQFLPSDVSYEEAMNVPQDAWRYIAGKIDLSDRDFEVLRALYRAEIAYLDMRIGELKQQLVEAGEWENTIFVVTGDHGENIGDHGLMDHQYCLYDTLLHVPLIIDGGSFSRGGETDRLVQLVDLAPTLLKAIDVPLSSIPEFQGSSFHPNSNTQPRERIFAEYLSPQPSMEALEKRVGLVPESVYQYDRSLRAIRTGEYKFIRGSDGSRELYNVTVDPGEKRNIADEKSEITTELDKQLTDWKESFKHADVSGSAEMSTATQNRLEDLGYLQ